jgi:hypothetical protein
MEQWRHRWERIGWGLILAASTLGVSFFVGSRPSALVVNNSIRRVGPGWGWFVLVFVAVALLGVYILLGTNLDCIWLPEKKAARLTDCRVSIHAEQTESKEKREEQEFQGCTYVFLTVANTGATATFSGYFDAISGLNRPDGTSVEEYSGKVAWEDTSEDRQIIGSGGRAKMILMCLFRDPQVCGWFQVPYSAKWASASERDAKKQLAGWLLVPENSGSEIAFDFQLVNETKTTSQTCRVKIDWNADGTVGDASVSAWR